MKTPNYKSAKVEINLFKHFKDCSKIMHDVLCALQSKKKCNNTKHSEFGKKLQESYCAPLSSNVVLPLELKL